ncbi:MAG: ABC transporter ATP-binding protein [Dehalococcoidia bacterium]
MTTGAQEPLVHLKGVHRQFPGDPPVAALIDIHLAIWPGEYVAITGPSGSGKSTLLNLLGCLDRPTEGEHWFASHEVGRLSDNQRAGFRARRVGFVFQAFHLLPHRSLLENLMLAGLYSGLPRALRREQAEAALARVGLSHRLAFRPTRLSGGERQRGAIARATVGRPPMLLCDEPTGNLDSASSAVVLRLLDEFSAAGQTIVLITHDMDVSARSRRQIRIGDGRIVSDTGRRA